MLGIPEELPDAVRTPLEAKQWVAEDYRTKGYVVIAEPSLEDLPEELCAFHMDFLARRDKEWVAIVVRRRNDISENTKALAEALEKRSDWILDLVVLPANPFQVLTGQAIEQEPVTKKTTPRKRAA
jgi:hypothetical protein